VHGRTSFETAFTDCFFHDTIPYDTMEYINVCPKADE